MCISPYTRKHEGRSITLPCGRCYPCKAKRISGWSFRIMKEAELSSASFFVTLTYNNESVPRTPNNYKSINKRHCQLYFKRLRKSLPKGITIKYYLAAEYGSKTMRPHYHIILLFFNDSKQNHDYESAIDNAWHLGDTWLGTTTSASTTYSLKYISKPSQIPLHQNDDRLKEFSLMSKRMGESYLTPQIIKWHKADLENRFYLPLIGGQKISMPEYFKQKIYTKIERNLIASYFANPEQYIELKIKHGNYSVKQEKALRKRLKYRLPTYNDKEFLQNEKIRINIAKKSNKETRLNPTL